TNVNPAGKRSLTCTLVAGSGPLSVSVTVKVIVSPTLGVGLLTALVTCRSACWGVSVVLALLLAGLGSNWSAPLTTAVLVWASGLATRAWICRVCGAPGATVPTAQVPVAGSYPPWLGVADRKVKPPGSRSETRTPVAASGPALVRVTVKVTVSPTFGLA